MNKSELIQKLQEHYENKKWDLMGAPRPSAKEYFEEEFNFLASIGLGIAGEHIPFYSDQTNAVEYYNRQQKNLNYRFIPLNKLED